MDFVEVHQPRPPSASDLIRGSHELPGAHGAGVLAGGQGILGASPRMTTEGLWLNSEKATNALT